MTETPVADQGSRILPGYREQREDERFIRDWEEQAALFKALPPIAAFDLSRMLRADWAHRFLISAGADPEQQFFMIYGAKFAQLLELAPTPELPPTLMELPPRYRPVFAQGCRDALAAQAPVCLAGEFDLGPGEHEAWRIAFAPLALEEGEPGQAVFGAFNRRLRRPQFL